MAKKEEVKKEMSEERWKELKERKEREKDTLEDNDASSNLHSVPLCKC